MSTNYAVCDYSTLVRLINLLPNDFKNHPHVMKMSSAVKRANKELEEEGGIKASGVVKMKRVSDINVKFLSTMKDGDTSYPILSFVDDSNITLELEKMSHYEYILCLHFKNFEPMYFVKVLTNREPTFDIIYYTTSNGRLLVMQRMNYHIGEDEFTKDENEDGINDDGYYSICMFVNGKDIEGVEQCFPPKDFTGELIIEPDSGFYEVDNTGDVEIESNTFTDIMFSSLTYANEMLSQITNLFLDHTNTINTNMIDKNLYVRFWKDADFKYTITERNWNGDPFKFLITSENVNRNYGFVSYIGKTEYTFWNSNYYNVFIYAGYTYTEEGFRSDHYIDQTGRRVSFLQVSEDRLVRVMDLSDYGTIYDSLETFGFYKNSLTNQVYADTYDHRITMKDYEMITQVARNKMLQVQSTNDYITLKRLDESYAKTSHWDEESTFSNAIRFNFPSGANSSLADIIRNDSNTVLCVHVKGLAPMYFRLVYSNKLEDGVYFVNMISCNKYFLAGYVYVRNEMQEETLSGVHKNADRMITYTIMNRNDNSHVEITGLDYRTGLYEINPNGSVYIPYDTIMRADSFRDHYIVDEWLRTQDTVSRLESSINNINKPCMQTSYISADTYLEISNASIIGSMYRWSGNNIKIDQSTTGFVPGSIIQIFTNKYKYKTFMYGWYTDSDSSRTRSIYCINPNEREYLRIDTNGYKGAEITLVETFDYLVEEFKINRILFTYSSDIETMNKIPDSSEMFRLFRTIIARNTRYDNERFNKVELLQTMMCNRVGENGNVETKINLSGEDVNTEYDETQQMYTYRVDAGIKLCGFAGYMKIETTTGSYAGVCCKLTNDSGINHYTYITNNHNNPYVKIIEDTTESVIILRTSNIYENTTSVILGSVHTPANALQAVIKGYGECIEDLNDKVVNSQRMIADVVKDESVKEYSIEFTKDVCTLTDGIISIPYTEMIPFVMINKGAIIKTYKNEKCVDAFVVKEASADVIIFSNYKDRSTLNYYKSTNNTIRLGEFDSIDDFCTRYTCIKIYMKVSMIEVGFDPNALSFNQGFIFVRYNRTEKISNAFVKGAVMSFRKNGNITRTYSYMGVERYGHKVFNNTDDPSNEIYVSCDNMKSDGVYELGMGYLGTDEFKGLCDTIVVIHPVIDSKLSYHDHPVLNYISEVESKVEELSKPSFFVPTSYSNMYVQKFKDSGFSISGQFFEADNCEYVPELNTKIGKFSMICMFRDDTCLDSFVCRKDDSTLITFTSPYTGTSFGYYKNTTDTVKLYIPESNLRFDFHNTYPEMRIYIPNNSTTPYPEFPLFGYVDSVETDIRKEFNMDVSTLGNTDDNNSVSFESTNTDTFHASGTTITLNVSGKTLDPFGPGGTISIIWKTASTTVTYGGVCIHREKIGDDFMGLAYMMDERFIKDHGVWNIVEGEFTLTTHMLVLNGIKDATTDEIQIIFGRTPHRFNTDVMNRSNLFYRSLLVALRDYDLRIEELENKIKTLTSNA